MEKEQKLSSNVAEFKKNFGEMKDSAVNAAKAATDSFGNLSEKDIKNVTARITESLSEFFKDKKESVVNAKDKCEGQIKDNPFIAVIGALAIGALIGYICKK